ncbi:tautomerase family protein [Herbiconiux sp.]|uniref:tautomerase family protein n=1 Tax=Herbiconiux sp. TaxID=1871186 RepID=UPI0025BA4F79|nr:tautomerase family protein [Herbiconiux sp.]
MPVINATVVAGTYDAAEKGELIAGFTNAVVAVKGEGVRPFVTVLLNEVESGDWGGGGDRITTELVLGAIAAGNEAAGEPASAIAPAEKVTADV